MQIETFRQIVSAVKLHCPSADIQLIEHWVDAAWLRLCAMRRWSWLIKEGEFTLPDVYATGTCSIGVGESVVTLTGGVVTEEMVGRQWRGGGMAYPMRTISRYLTPTTFEIDRPWGSGALAGASFEIYSAYVTVPEDFQSFLSIFDPRSNQPLSALNTMEMLNRVDPQRSQSSNTASDLVFVGLSRDASGGIDAPIPARGTGPLPVASGTYEGVNDAIYIAEIQTGGASGVATYKWKEGAGAYSPTVLTSTAEVHIARGLMLAFPSGTPYVSGDVALVQCHAAGSPGLPRYEVWPHVKTRTALPFIYAARAESLTDYDASLPRLFRGDVLLKLALGECAKWPGEEGRPNPYYRLTLAQQIAKELTGPGGDIAFLERNDEEIQLNNFRYDSQRPRGRDDAYWQSHAPAPWELED